MRYLTSGESHGPQLTAIIEGVPSGVQIQVEIINEALRERQKGYGRGGRMKIEKDQVQIVSGVRHGFTTGAPITLIVENRDWKNWSEIMASQLPEDYTPSKIVSRPRPGHADLVGGMKYKHRDLRNVLERSSARETAIRVAVGAVAKQILTALHIELSAHVVEIGGVKNENEFTGTLEELREAVNASEVKCFDKEVSLQMIERIDEAKGAGNTVGGVIEVIVENVPAGIGSYVHYDRKLDGKIAQGIMSIQAFKGVEFGKGFELGQLLGSEVMDEIAYSEADGYTRLTNRLGGFEGGMTNGMPLIVRGVMKPIPTLYKPLKTVDIDTKLPFEASIERSDACAVPAASVVCEHVVAWEVANAIVEQFGGDHFQTLLQRVNEFKEELRNF